LSFASGVLVSAPFVGTAVTVAAAIVKVDWALLALLLFVGIDLFWLISMAMAGITGVAG
jgi:hypothetical protein